MSKEIKVALFVIIATIIAFVGSKFLLGKGMLDSNNTYYVMLDQSSGLYKSSIVTINGFKVGQVGDLEFIKEGKNAGKIKTALSVKPEYKIPEGSLAVLASEGLMGEMLIKIQLNKKSNKILDNESFLTSGVELGMVDNLSGKFTPVADNLNTTLNNVNQLFDFEKQNVQSLNYTVENLNKLLSTYSKTGTALNQKINQLDKTLANLEAFTATLSQKSESLGKSLDNVESLTTDLKDAELKQTLLNLKEASNSLNGILAQVKSTDNTVGALLNDKALYNNLDKASNNLNLLLKDVRLHPGRYVTIQVFGKKNKQKPITSDEE